MLDFVVTALGTHIHVEKRFAVSNIMSLIIPFAAWKCLCWIYLCNSASAMAWRWQTILFDHALTPCPNSEVSCDSHTSRKDSGEGISECALLRRNFWAFFHHQASGKAAAWGWVWFTFVKQSGREIKSPQGKEIGHGFVCFASANSANRSVILMSVKKKITSRQWKYSKRQTYCLNACGWVG